MPYRICKMFEVESGHMLSKHRGLCRHPHGHTRRIEVVIAADSLDPGDMVCDFKTLKLALADYLGRLDHSLAINSSDPLLRVLRGTPAGERLVVFEDRDPTTEVMAERIFRFLEAEMGAGAAYRDAEGLEYRFPPGLRLERVRVWETSTSWAEFGFGA